jgi:hypothetical protein
VWTNSWQRITGACSGLIGVGAGKEQARRVQACGPPSVEQTSRLGSRDPVADEVKWAAWWQEQQDEVMDGFLVEPQNQGRAGRTWEPSHEWRLAGGYTEFTGFAVVHHKITGLLS